MNSKKPDSEFICVTEEPKEYSKLHRYLILGLVSMAGILGPLASTIYFPSANSVIRSLDTTSAKFDLTIGGFMITLGIMPLIWGGISDRYGRRWVYISSLMIDTLGNLGAGFSRSITQLILMRVVQGIGSSASMVTGVGVVADIFPKEEIGLAMSTFFVGVLIGPIVGPIVGGFLDAKFGWQSSFFFLAILSGLTTMAFLLFFKETLPIANRKVFPIVVRNWRIQRGGPLFNPFSALWYLRYPAVIMAGGIPAICFGVFSGVESFHSRAMTMQYKLTPDHVGLTFIVLGTGSALGNFSGGRLADYMSRRSRDVDGKSLPEARLRGVWTFILVLVSGLLFYGWCLELYMPIWMPLVSSLLVGFGFASTTIATSSYLVELAPAYASSIMAASNAMTMAAATITSSLNSFLVESLGFGRAISVYAGVSLFALILTLILVKFGPRIRSKTGPHQPPS